MYALDVQRVNRSIPVRGYSYRKDKSAYMYDYIGIDMCVTSLTFESTDI